MGRVCPERQCGIDDRNGDGSGRTQRRHGPPGAVLCGARPKLRRAIGERKTSDIRPEKRTTPAGRFVSELSVNLQGEDIVWVDYDAAVSMHRVRTNNKAERLASVNAEEHCISYGCINVPALFYDTRVKLLFGNARGVVYVLPETRVAREYFRFLPRE